MNYTITLFLILFILSPSFGQTDTLSSVKKKYYLVQKTDGSELIGEILKDDGREILLLTKSIGKIFINKTNIKSLTILEESKLIGLPHASDYQDYRTEGPYTTRYFFTTNALPIKKGEHYAMLGLQGPEVHFAVDDNLSLGVMSTWIGSPLALASKYSFNSTTNTHFSVGTIVGTSGYFSQGQYYGGLYFATITQGNRESNISFSAGYAHINLERDEIYSSEYQITSKSGIYLMDADVVNAYSKTPNAVNMDQTLYSSINKNYRGSTVLSIGGIHSIGKSSSIIFDAMAFIGNRYSYESVSTSNINDLTYTNYQGIERTEDFTLNTMELVKRPKTTLILMPSIRINQSYKKAFQIALAGVVAQTNDGNWISFPVPTVSWLRQF